MNTHSPHIRAIQRVINSQLVTDGDGVKILRSVVQGAMGTLDPFLMLDEIASDQAQDYIGGFPEHPHRGFETVTYMLEGRMRHRDHLGNEGLLASGGVQWMTAGRGVLHSEMPEQTSGRLHGFQLWVNLPAAEKMSAPNYQEFAPQQVPSIELGESGRIKLIAGTLSLQNQVCSGPVTGVTTQPDLLDVELSTHQSLELPVDPDKQVLIYVYQGQLDLPAHTGLQTIPAHKLVIMGAGNHLQITSQTKSRFLVLAGRPIGEPIVNRGPFVMNTREEIDQAIRDYQNGTLVE